MRFASTLQIKAPAAILLFSCCLAWAQSTQPASSKRLPVPKATPQAVADRKVREAHREEYRRKDVQSRLALAHALREEADKSADDPAMRFVLLREARELAVDAGDFEFAFDVIDEITRHYIVDPQEMKASALTVGFDKAGVSPPELCEAYLKIGQKEYEAWNLDLAWKAALLSRDAAGRNPDLKERSSDLVKRINQHRREANAVQAAFLKLRREPDDPMANLILGRHLCWSRDRWEEGMSHLAKGPEGPLKQVAEKDLQNPTEPAAISELADQWWDLKDPRSGVTPEQAHRRAAYWYEKALPSLSGGAKATAENRVAASRREGR